MKQSLNLRLSQTLTMTPQLQQSIRLLQLSAAELNVEIQDALDNNPLLEELPEDSTTLPESEKQPLTDAAESYDYATPTDVVASDDAPVAADVEVGQTWGEDFEPAYASDSHASSGDAFEPGSRAAAPETLVEHLLWQARMTSISERDREIAKVLIRSINAEGYLRMSIPDIQQLFPAELDIDEREIHAVLSLIQSFEPAGVGARDLGERIRILLDQTTNKTPGLSVAKKIASDHLDLLGRRDLAKLKRVLGVGDRELQTAVQLITSVDPRISGEYVGADTRYIIPDIIVRKVRGAWQVNLNPELRKSLHVNPVYRNWANNAGDAKQSQFLKEKLSNAKWFIKSLSNRYDTLLRVANEIVARQQAFLEHGESKMQPMVLNDIAEKLDMHSSTISRATSNKYMLTPRGVFELKYFFSSSITTADGRTSSSVAVRDKIRSIIRDEPPRKPVSDNKIAELLAQLGLQVARRTVAKYREEMNIPSSSQRRALARYQQDV